MLVIKPKFDYSTLPALAGLGSGLFAGIAYTLVRSMKGRFGPNRIIFTFSLISSAITAPFLLAAPLAPSAAQWWALAGTGVFAAGGQFGLTFAYHHARVSRISIFTYLHVLFALVVGFVVWNERPDPVELGGRAADRDGGVAGEPLRSGRRPLTASRTDPARSFGADQPLVDPADHALDALQVVDVLALRKADVRPASGGCPPPRSTRS